MMIEKVFINRHLGIKFNSYIDQKLRVWFKAKEVAQILGYKNTNDAIKKHVSENHKRNFLLSCPRETQGQVIKDKKGVVKRDLPGGEQECIFLDEAGFYELVFKSRLPAAKMFREWVFTKVLPSIRKYGYYRMFDDLKTRKVIINEKKFYKHPVFDNYGASKKGDIINIKTKKILSKNKNNGNGYLIFCLCNEKLEEKKNYYQHRFVYEVFKGMIPSIMEIDHRNTVRNDNRIKNLQLITPTQNKQKSNNKPIISINLKTGDKIRFNSITQAGKELNIIATSISSICKVKFRSTTSKSDGCKYTFRYLD